MIKCRRRKKESMSIPTFNVDVAFALLVAAVARALVENLFLGVQNDGAGKLFQM